MALYSLSCSLYSFAIESLVKTFRAKSVYVGGQLVYSIGMVFMALARSKWGVILFSWSAGIMYSTLFTMPYLIVAHYHETDTVLLLIRVNNWRVWTTYSSSICFHCFSSIKFASFQVRIPLRAWKNFFSLCLHFQKLAFFTKFLVCSFC